MWGLFPKILIKLLSNNAIFEDKYCLILQFMKRNKREKEEEKFIRMILLVAWSESMVGSYG
jgi:hypothetical protein